MKKLEYTVQFNTPAFLGDSAQNGRWRTPPIKAQLRQWWRVVYAAEHGYPGNVNGMRTEEGLLFGHAWLENDQDRQGNNVAARKSKVRIRLDLWDEGRLRKEQWPGFSTVTHPEVRQAVASDLYLGYGPVTLPRGERRPTLKANAAIQAGEEARLSIALPDEHAPRLARALWLMDRYGTLGGRSRNGWGSYALAPAEETAALLGTTPLCDWKKCLDFDWPHAIGHDDNKKTNGNGALIWQTAPQADWKALMKTLAVLKIGLRTQFVFPNVAPPHAGIEPRHWLSYPITRHTTKAWDRGARLPNQLRFKVRTTADGQLVGVIFHMPHLPPAAFLPDRPAIQRVWRQVHDLLDHLGTGSPRTYPMIPELPPVHRRSALKPHLDTITLTRIPD